MRWSLILTFSSVLLTPLLAAGQVYKCGDTWTTKPCEGGAALELPAISRNARIPEQKPAADAEPPKQEPLSPRLSLIRRLKKLNREYLDRGAVGLNKTEIEGFEKFCLDRTRPLIDCQNLFDEHSTRLRELELAKEANDLAAERNLIEQRKIDRLGSR